MQWVKGYPATTSKIGDVWKNDIDFAKWLSDNDKSGETWK
jgi:hypothetical protein